MIATNDERNSQSPSDDGSSCLYPDAHKIDPELDADEEGGSLTSQTLNADGTPKRPMNAFMIFARRRRPQVSSENQSMRTGEISKILSKEWNSMPSSEKQFYLDRAKQLKETFNSKYPDYVYRRRPNNSRKRRRTDASSHSVDGSAPPDPGDDLARVGDLGESSPTEGDDSHFDAHSVHYLRLPHDTSQTYGDHGSLQSRTPSMLYTGSDPYRHTSSHDSRLPYLSTGQDRNHSIPPPNTLPSPRTGVPPLHSFLGSHPSTGPSSIYSSQSGAHGGGPGWESRLDSHTRSTSSGWLGGSTGPSSDRASSMSASRAPSYTGSSSSPTGSWPSGSPNPSGGPGGSAAGGAGAMYEFPTLNSPFYPPQSQSQLHASGAGSGGIGNGASSGVGVGGGSGSGGRSGSYDHRPYAGSPSLSPGSYTPTNGNGRDSFGGQSGSRHGSSILPRALPPVQSIPGYAQPHSLFSSSSATSSSSDLHDIWSRSAVNGPP